MSDDADARWQASMQRPVTRGELLHALQGIQIALMGQALTDNMIVFADKPEQRQEAAAKSVDHASHVLDTIRQLVDSWKAEDDDAAV